MGRFTCIPSGESHNNVDSMHMRYGTAFREGRTYTVPGDNCKGTYDDMVPHYGRFNISAVASLRVASNRFRMLRLGCFDLGASISIEHCCNCL